jgi:acyl-CoA dehydrogenase
MANPSDADGPADGPSAAATSRDAICPLSFSTASASVPTDLYLRDPSTRALVEFFQAKGLHAIKEEDQRQQWHEDWIAYQATHGLYRSLLSPKKYSSLGNQFDLLRLTRFLEVFAYFSPAHGYSLQVTFLGLYAVLMGSNDALKQEAVAALEHGGLFAFGVSEKNHGSDLLGNDFNVAPAAPGRWIANGSKYYIGNANCASIISILARKADDRPASRARRATPVLFALRPSRSKGFGDVRKIRTLGIRSAFVGSFDVNAHEFPDTDLIAEGRDAWDAVFGTVALGKFFLGFGSIGICERAFQETISHVAQRVLYGKPVMEMPHIASAISQAYARLTAMKLYAFRALDYFQSATANDRRHLLFGAVQKARVSTEGVTVISLLSECVGARGFESDTYFKMARRDIQLIPSLEGSMHINLELTSRFIPAYFNDPDPNLPAPNFAAGRDSLPENPYLMEARSGQINAIKFRPYRDAYQSLKSIPNVRNFARQARAFQRFVQITSSPNPDTQTSIVLGHCLAIIAHAQLVAENAASSGIAPQLISTIFHTLVNDLSTAAIALASSRGLNKSGRNLIKRVMALPQTAAADWDFVLLRARSAVP